MGQLHEQINGLSHKQVLLAREKYGVNRLTGHKQKRLVQSFLESFGDPIIKILLIALAVNVIFMFKHQNWFESLGIGVAILLATLVSTLSERGSQSAFEKMQAQAAAIRCRVVREGGVCEIPVAEVVVGDTLLLQAGDRIPADGVLLEGKLEVDQSALNGESKEAKKYPANFASNTDCKEGDFLNPTLLFSSSIVCAGEAYMQVTEVGDQTFFGKIGAELQHQTRESPLKVRLAKLANAVGKIGYTAAAITAFAYLFNVFVLDLKFDSVRIFASLSEPSILFPHLMKALTLAVTVIVMAVPEGLPMMITVVLSSNMKRMLKDNVLVRKLVGLETAGSLNILFTDKTGTLTKGQLSVTHFISGDGKLLSPPALSQQKNYRTALLSTALWHNNAAALQGKTPIGGNATDRALLTFASDLGQSKTKLQKAAVVPFDSKHKIMTTTVTGDLAITFVKGAPEKLIPHCKYIYNEDGTLQLFHRKQALRDQMNSLSSQAIRMIAVATADPSLQGEAALHNMTFLGLIGLRDDVRSEAVSAVRQVQSAGIQTVMITGDSPLTAAAIAKDVGLLRGSHDVVLTSAQLAAMRDEEVAEILPRLRVVARALPSDKSRLVRIAQSKELVVGMTGDGVNDAPALKQADIGFAMGSGTEVAKEAGDVVILDDNFASIAKAIGYGRTIFKSIRKFIIYQLSICMCAVGVTIAGPLLGVDFPITVIQMLWINIVMDTLAGMAFSGEKMRKKYMQEAPKRRDEPMLNSYMKGQIVINSLFSTVLCLLFLKHPFFDRLIGMGDPLYKMTAFFALFMFLAIFTSFCARTHSINLFEYLSANKPFLFIMGLVGVVQLFILYYGGVIFRTVKLDPKDLCLVVVLSFSIIPIDLLRKYIVSKTVGITGT